MNVKPALPKISIVTPSFNQGDYIEKTIDSVLSQGYPNLEYIIIDGGSTDQSVQVIRKYERFLHHWISENDRGQSHAINKGMARASGSILTWINSDDRYEPGALTNFVDLFGQNDLTGLAVGAGLVRDLTGAVVYDSKTPTSLEFDCLCGWLSSGGFLQPASAFSQLAWRQCGPLREDVHMAMDLDLWLRITKSGFRGVTSPNLIATALSHPKAKTTAFVNEMLIDCARVIASHGSIQGYEDLASKLMARERAANFKLDWFQRNYGVVVSHRLLRFLQPVVKRFSAEGKYWQGSVPPWDF